MFSLNELICPWCDNSLTQDINYFNCTFCKKIKYVPWYIFILVLLMLN